MCSKLKVFLLTGCFLLIATTVIAENFWTFHTGHTVKYTRAKSDKTDWPVTMTIGAGGQSQCSRSDYYKVDVYNYDNDGATNTNYLRVTENEAYQCQGGTTEIKFFQAAPEGTGWSYGTDTDGVKFQVVAQTRFSAYYVIRRYEIQGGVNKPAVFTHFAKGVGLVKEVDNWVSDNAPWTQTRHGYRGRTLYTNFTGYGLYVYDYDGAGSWTKVNDIVSTSMVAAGPLLYATFEGYGLYVWDGSTWTRINDVVPTNMVSSSSSGGALYATFTGYGLYKWNGSSWIKLNDVIPESMAVSSDTLYATFTGYGLYRWDNTNSTWIKINDIVPVKILAGQ